MTEAIAIFVDFDNVAIGAREARCSFDIGPLVERVLTEGRVVLKRVYADWTGHESHKRALHEAGFELIDIPARKWSGKNAADIRMVVDALDLCHRDPKVDTFVIVSGDSDFTPLVSRLRAHHRRVIGIGFEHTASSLLIDACDSFVFYDELLERKSKRAPRPADDASQVIDWVVDMVSELEEDREPPLQGSVVKQTLKRRRPGFSERRHGFKNFSHLLEEAARKDLLDIQPDPVGGGYRIRSASA